MSFRKTITIFSCVLTLACAIAIHSVISTVKLDTLNLLGLYFVLVSLIFGLVYLILGFTKNLSKLYKASILIGALNALMSILLSLNESFDTTALITTSLAFALYVVMLVANNLGRKKSFIICIIIMSIRITGIITNYLILKDFMNPQVLNICGQFAIIVMVFAATSAKYVDKSSRNAE